MLYLVISYSMSKTLCDQSDKLAQRGVQGTRVSNKNALSKKFIDDLKDETIDSKTAGHMAALCQILVFRKPMSIAPCTN